MPGEKLPKVFRKHFYFLEFNREKLEEYVKKLSEQDKQASPVRFGVDIDKETGDEMLILTSYWGTYGGTPFISTKLFTLKDLKIKYNNSMENFLNSFQCIVIFGLGGVLINEHISNEKIEFTRSTSIDNVLISKIREINKNSSYIKTSFVTCCNESTLKKVTDFICSKSEEFKSLDIFRYHIDYQQVYLEGIKENLEGQQEFNIVGIGVFNNMNFDAISSQFDHLIEIYFGATERINFINEYIDKFTSIILGLKRKAGKKDWLVKFLEDNTALSSSEEIEKDKNTESESTQMASLSVSQPFLYNSLRLSM